jgi:hypothetical protein
MKSQQQQQGLTMVLATKFYLDLNMSLVTQHSVQRTLVQDRDSRMSICGDLIINADKDRMFLNLIITGDKNMVFSV